MKERRIHVRNMQERREFVRFEIDQMVEIEFGQERFVRAEALDLSERGLQCKTDGPVDLNSRIFLMFRIPIRHEEFEIKCDGIVVRVTENNGEYLVGVQFTDLGPVETKAIEAYAREAVPEQEKAAMEKAKAAEDAAAAKNSADGDQ